MLSCYALVTTLTLLAGARPYEMVWAGRTEDQRPPLVAFDDLEGWRVECDNAVVSFAPTDDQPLFRDRTAKLTYRRDVPGATSFRLVPPAPMPVATAFDSVNWWVYGNNWAFAPDASTPPVSLVAVFGSPGGPDVPITVGSVYWQEWWLMHRRLDAAQVAALGERPELRRIEVTGGSNRDDRTIYLANLSVYTDERAPLTYDPRPARNLTPLPGQDLGTNTGPGTLPFPTREETILPGDGIAVAGVANEADRSFRWLAQGDPPTVWTLRPETGTLSDLTVSLGARESFRPLDEGGVRLVGADGQTVVPERVRILEVRKDGDGVRVRVVASAGAVEATVDYVFRVWNRSLVVDVLSTGGSIAEVAFGKARVRPGTDAKLVTMPFLTYGGNRPAVLVLGESEAPIFLAGFPDWYRSNASRLEARNRIDPDGAACYNGAAVYLPRTDGVRNDCSERLFITLAPRFEDVLPRLANPRSPWMDVMAERVWIAYGASDRANDLATWTRYRRLGMEKILVTDHETGWRDGGESFTLRTRPAPGKGGDEGQERYADAMHALGFRYGIYNNYTDFAPVNEHWNEDYVSHLPDDQWRGAWPRCYHLKPSRAVELEARLSPIIQQKFGLDTAYCDVHTAVQPWDYTDFDARVPGAATFAATYYAYGELMLHQKATWNGPVYSEGNSHWTYVGLTDGNYGQDHLGRLPVVPWLVDFDLRVMHPHGASFGMGNPEMFYGYGSSLGATPEERTRNIDRFLAATVAFGHTGFFVTMLGDEGAARSYFLLQQLASRYGADLVRSIRYADADGALLDTSRAVAGEAHARSQIRTEYEGGVVTCVNGSVSEDWLCEAPAEVLRRAGLRAEETGRLRLPPNGWIAWDSTGGESGLVVASTDLAGRRVDYADTPAYLYADARGSFTRFPRAATDGALSALPDGSGGFEVIPYGETRHLAVSLGGSAAEATALDAEHNPLGKAETRLCRGLVHIAPVAGAVSYRLVPVEATGQVLTCDRTEVVPGERVSILGREAHEFVVPRDAAEGQILYPEFEGSSIDLLVRPMVEARLRLEAPPGTASPLLHLTLRSALPSEEEARVVLGEDVRDLTLPVERELALDFALSAPAEGRVWELPLRVTSQTSEFAHTWWLKAEPGRRALAELPATWEVVQRLRAEGRVEEPVTGETGANGFAATATCDGVGKAGIAMHPAWLTGPGYVGFRYPPVTLPDSPAAALRCEVGKRDGSDPGDGILYIVRVTTADDAATEAGRLVVREHRWTPFEVDLSRWAGQRVVLTIIADPGEAADTTGDHACWSGLEIVEREPSLGLTLHEAPVELRHAPGPHPLAGITLEEIRAARRGWVSYEAVGLEASAAYPCTLAVNGVDVGSAAAGKGDEVAASWGEAVRVELTREAIAALTASTTIELKNLGSDYFKIRRFTITLELADGRLLSSDIHTPAYTQPPSWAHAEGTGVPFGEDITADVSFALHQVR